MSALSGLDRDTCKMIFDMLDIDSRFRFAIISRAAMNAFNAECREIAKKCRNTADACSMGSIILLRAHIETYKPRCSAIVGLRGDHLMLIELARRGLIDWAYYADGVVHRAKNAANTAEATLVTEFLGNIKLTDCRFWHAPIVAYSEFRKILPFCSVEINTSFDEGCNGVFDESPFVEELSDDSSLFFQLRRQSVNFCGACFGGHIEEVRKKLHRYDMTGRRNRYCMPEQAFQSACFAGKTEIAKLIFEYMFECPLGANCNPDAAESCVHAISYAIRGQRAPELVELMLEAIEHFDISRLHDTARIADERIDALYLYHATRDASKYGLTAVCRKLIGLGAQCFENAFIDACSGGCIDTTIPLLLEYFEPNQETLNAALIKACVRGRHRTVEFLLDRYSYDSATITEVLTAACVAGHSKTVAAILDNPVMAEQVSHIDIDERRFDVVRTLAARGHKVPSIIALETRFQRTVFEIIAAKNVAITSGVHKNEFALADGTVIAAKRPKNGSTGV